jgi:hypothetical protein
MAKNPIQKDTVTTGYSLLTDVTGTGAAVYATNATLVTPTLGAAIVTTINKVTVTTPAVGATLTIATGKTATFNSTVTFSGTDGSTLTFGTGGTVVYAANNISALAASTSAQFLAACTDETGTGLLVFNNTPTFIAPVLGACSLTTANGLTINATTGTLTIANGSTLATSGAFPITLTATAASNVTVPASGTLITSASLPTVASQAEVDAEVEDTKIVTSLKLGAKTASWRQFIGLQSVLNYSAGTWTRTRISGGDYVQRKTAAADTTVMGIDITPEFRTASLKGMRLDSFDGITRNNTADLLVHGVTLYRVSYTDTGLVTTTAIPTTGAFPTTQNANPRVTNIPVNTPAFFTEGDKYVIEITLQAALTSAYDFIGLVLRFTKTV